MQNRSLKKQGVLGYILSAAVAENVKAVPFFAKIQFGAKTHKER